MDKNTLHELSLKFKGIVKDAPFFSGNVLTDVDMSKRCTMRVGGNAPLVIEPATVTSLIYALRICNLTEKPFIIGGASNLIINDDGFDCPVLSVRALLSVPVSTSSTVSCASGNNMASLVDYCTEHSLSGLEPFAGLPGTVGGAVYMNARCFDTEIGDVLLGCDYVDASPAALETISSMLLQHYETRSSDWQYKSSPFQGTNCIITSAVFRVQKGDKSAIDKKCKEIIALRKAKGHFRAPSAGSIFRNNRAFGKPSGVLIDEAGLKGYTIGGAQIAPWHGNIIINTGTATYSDIAALIKLAHDTVLEKTGFNLTPEVLLLPRHPLN